MYRVAVPGVWRQGGLLLDVSCRCPGCLFADVHKRNKKSHCGPRSCATVDIYSADCQAKRAEGEFVTGQQGRSTASVSLLLDTQPALALICITTARISRLKPFFCKWLARALCPKISRLKTARTGIIIGAVAAVVVRAHPHRHLALENGLDGCQSHICHVPWHPTLRLLVLLVGSMPGRRRSAHPLGRR